MVISHPFPFAWYTASKGDVAKNGISDTLITASADSYSMDGLSISVAFANVDAGTDYVPAVMWQESEASEPGYVADGVKTPAHFANVALTDSKGDTYVKVTGQSKIVNANAANSKWYGTAKIVVTVKVGDSAVTMNTANEVYAAYEGTYTVTVVGEAGGYTRVRNAAPSERGTTDGAIAVSTTLVITIASDGKITTSEGSNSLEKQFWYLESPKNENATTADETTDHDDHGIKVTVA